MHVIRIDRGCVHLCLRVSTLFPVALMAKVFVYFLFPGADVNRATSNSDHTVLSLACAGGHLTVVQYLLLQGADPSYVLKVSCDHCLLLA